MLKGEACLLKYETKFENFICDPVLQNDIRKCIFHTKETRQNSANYVPRTIFIKNLTNPAAISVTVSFQPGSKQKTTTYAQTYTGGAFSTATSNQQHTARPIMKYRA